MLQYQSDMKTNADNSSSKTENMKLKKKYTENISSALLYGICSTSMAFLNKAVISSYSFDFPLFIMTCQMIICIILLETFRISRTVSISKYTLTLGKFFLWPSLCYALHSFTALHALEGMSIPMYAAVKRCAPLVTLFLSVILLQKNIPSLRVILSVIFITAGCLLASAGDLKFDFGVYRYGAVSVFAQGLYLTLAQKSLQSMSALDALYINSYNTVFFFAILSMYIESEKLLQFQGYLDITFIFCFILQTSMGVLLNYTLYLCTEKNSALTTSIIGVLKSILQTVIGFFTFGGIQFNALNILGLGINLFGSTLYSYSKYKEKNKTCKVYNYDFKQSIPA